VPLDRVWVNANFKEGQLRQMRVGQAATLTADAYGGTVTYHGTIAGLGAGTGAAFALLPAQNATGNWIKVVQRLPVRIALESGELAAHPLRVGLSMQVAVSLRDGSDPRPAPARPDSPADRTNVFSAESEGADALVQRIIAANGGSPSEGGSRPVAPRHIPARYRDAVPDRTPP